TGVSEYVVRIDFEQFLSCRNGVVYKSVIEVRHPKAMQGILIFRVKAQSLLICLNSLVQLVITKCVDCLFEILFLGHRVNFIPSPLRKGREARTRQGEASRKGEGLRTCAHLTPSPGARPPAGWSRVLLPRREKLLLVSQRLDWTQYGCTICRIK